MKIDVNKSTFRDAFRRAGRSDSFSYEGLGALYDYLMEVEDDTGEEYELDAIELCGEFCEYGDLEELIEEEGIDTDGIDEDDEDKLMEVARDHFSVFIEVGTGAIIVNNQ